MNHLHSRLNGELCCHISCEFRSLAIAGNSCPQDFDAGLNRMIYLSNEVVVRSDHYVVDLPTF